MEMVYTGGCMMKKRFVTLFPELENVHLMKDVGLVPYVMFKEFGYDSYIASYRSDKLEYLKTNVKGLKILGIEKYSKKAVVNVSIFLLRYAKRIDILNIFHMSRASMVWIGLYKFLNKSGKVYLKLDTNLQEASNEIADGISFHFIKRNICKCDLITSETEDVKNLLEKTFFCNIIHLSNGVLESDIYFPMEKKEKIIMTSGRLGTSQKNTEMLIEAFAGAVQNISEKWILLLVGSMTEEFKKYVKKKIRESHLTKRIILYGYVGNREELASLYSKCTIFTMPSKWEGFPLSAVEAAARGDYLLASDLPCFIEITDYGKYGTVFENGNLEAYVKSMTEICSCIDNGNWNVDYSGMEKHVRKNYSWERICRKINDELSF